MALEDEEGDSGWKEAAAARVMSPAGTDLTAGIRRLPVWAFVVVAVVYLVIVQGVSKLLTAGLHTTYAAPTSVNELWRSITVPVLVSLVFVYAVVGVLGWWRPVFTDDRPVRAWVWVIPVIIACPCPCPHTVGRCLPRRLRYCCHAVTSISCCTSGSMSSC